MFDDGHHADAVGQQLVGLARNAPGLLVLAGKVALHHAQRLEVRQHALADTGGLQFAQRRRLVESITVQRAAGGFVAQPFGEAQARAQQRDIGGVAEPLQQLQGVVRGFARGRRAARRGT